MNKLTLSVLRSLAETLVHELDRTAPRSTSDGCREFVVAFYDSMQPLYRVTFMVLSAWFALASRLAYRKTVSRLTVEECSRVAEQWRTSGLSIQRDFIKVLFTLIIVSYYDDEASTTRLGIERTAYLKSLSFYTGSGSHG